MTDRTVCHFNFVVILKTYSKSILSASVTISFFLMSSFSELRSGFPVGYGIA